MKKDETVASTITGWPLEPDPSGPKLPTFDRRDDRFVLGPELGRGGMGRVVAASDLALDRGVAIKVAISNTPENLMRFEREVRITARLEHPSIPPVHEAGRDADGNPFYVMRRVEGDRLADRIRAATTPRARLALVPNVLAAVDAAAFAHARGIIHRDIKPANILVGAYGETLLIDWGLARRLDEADRPTTQAIAEADGPLTRAGDVYGTPGYMSPEQARGEPVDPRADVYALGATLFNVIDGKPAFDLPLGEWIERAVQGAAPPLERIGPEVPPELVAIVGKAMAPLPADRYPDAGALATDLRAFLAGQLVAAHHYTARERLARFVRRHRVAVGVSAAALIATVVIGVVSIVGIMRARDRAEAERAIAADRAQVMLLDRASTLAPHDPTRAVALLRQISPRSPYLARARDIASAAAAYGITRASATSKLGLDPVQHLAISPDGRWLGSAGKNGLVRLHELATGKTRELARVGDRVGGLVWTDGGASLCVVASDGLWRIAVPSGERLLLDREARSHDLWLGPEADRVRYIDDERELLVERSTRDGEAPIVLARDVTKGTGMGSIALIASVSRVSVLSGTRETLLVREPKLYGGDAFAISLDGSKIAAASGDQIFEWSIEGHELQRYPARRTIALQYGPLGLYGVTETELAHFVNGMVLRLRENTQQVVWTGATAVGPAFVSADGTVTVVDELGVQDIPGDLTMTRGIAASPHSRFLAAGSLDGRVRWWDLTYRSPEVLGPFEGEPCFVDATQLVAYSTTRHLISIDRRTGKSRRFDDPALAHPHYCAGAIDNFIALSVPTPGQPTLIVDLRTFTLTSVTGIEHVRGDRAVDRFVYLRGKELVEAGGTLADARVRWTAHTAIDSFVSNGRWIAAQAGDSIVRIDRQTGTLVPHVVADAELAGITSDGVVWWLANHTLWSSDGKARRERHRFTTALYTTASFGNHLGLWLADGSIWVAGPTAIINRAPPGQRNVRFGAGQAVNVEGGGALVTRSLVTGEQVVRRVRFANVIHLSDDGTLVVVVGARALVFPEAVPRDPALLHAWLETATNAWLDPDTGELTWR